MVESAEPTEAEADAMLEEFGGDARGARRALLSDIATFAADDQAAGSRDYVRGRFTGGGWADYAGRRAGGDAARGRRTGIAA